MGTTPEITRRKVVVAGVWTTPIIVAAIAAPAAAASTPLRTIELLGEPDPVGVGEEFTPITVQIADGGTPVGAGQGVSFSIISGNATFADGNPTAQITNTYEDGQATAFGMVAGNNPGTVTIQVASGSASSTLNLTIIG